MAAAIPHMALSTSEVRGLAAAARRAPAYVVSCLGRLFELKIKMDAAMNVAAPHIRRAWITVSVQEMWEALYPVIERLHTYFTKAEIDDVDKGRYHRAWAPGDAFVKSPPTEEADKKFEAALRALQQVPLVGLVDLHSLFGLKDRLQVAFEDVFQACEILDADQRGPLSQSSCGPSSATPSGDVPMDNAPRSNRKALLFGISETRGMRRLPGALADIRTMKEVLKQRHFPDDQISVLANLNSDAMLSKVIDFAGSLKRGDVVYVHFSGHGLSAMGEQCVQAADGQPIRLSLLLDHLNQAGVTIVIVLDCCRKNKDDPESARRMRDGAESADSDGSVQVTIPDSKECHFIIIYATAPGEAAWESMGRGLYSSTLAAEMRNHPEAPFLHIASAASDSVRQQTKQRAWISSTASMFTQEFRF